MERHLWLGFYTVVHQRTKKKKFIEIVEFVSNTHCRLKRLNNNNNNITKSDLYLLGEL